MTPSRAEQRAVAWIAGIAHFFSHLFEPIFYVVALVLPLAFDVTYETALTLIIAGKLLYGLAAPAAGWLGDRWSATGMMAVFFLGLGASGVWAGMADSATEMMLALAALGLFGSIYHPVGIAWLVRSATARGKALGFNGVFGGLGPGGCRCHSRRAGGVAGLAGGIHRAVAGSAGAGCGFRDPDSARRRA